jgi:hypothetical protein
MNQYAAEWREHTQGLKPNFVVGMRDPRLKPWAT